MDYEFQIGEKIKEYAEKIGGLYYPEHSNYDSVVQYHNLIFGLQYKLKADYNLLRQLVELSGVHYKVAIFNILPKGIIDNFVVFAKATKILLFQIDEEIIPFGMFNLFEYRHKPKRLLRLPNYRFEIPSGVPSPRRISERAINSVELELFAFENNDRGVVNYSDILKFGFERIPKEFIKWDYNLQKYRFREENLPSKKYKHIYDGIMKTREKLK